MPTQQQQRSNPGRHHLKNKVINIVVATALVIAVAALIGSWYMDSVRGNKLPSALDTYQKFNVAYIYGDDGKWERVAIASWLPIGERIQVVTTNDVPIYTHFSNVKLTCE